MIFRMKTKIEQQNLPKYQQIRPYAELDEAVARILTHAYAYIRERCEPIPGPVLRYGADARPDDLRRGTEAGLLNDEGSDRFRPTVVGLLYVPEALADVHAL